MRDKKNTQDNPFDEIIVSYLEHIPDCKCLPAPGPLVNPDLVLINPEELSNVSSKNLQDSLSTIIGIEVKKLERTQSGPVARASGLDYNTTPPCGTITLHDENSSEIHVHAFYLFACVEQIESNNYIVSALVLCDGDLLNEDFDFYKSITGERDKEIDLGSYGNGANRVRPMLIFSNPLGIPELDYAATLIHSNSDLTQQSDILKLVFQIERTTQSGENRLFSCYRVNAIEQTNDAVKVLRNPFPKTKRSNKTSPRGKFMLPYSIGI